jgi:hypothetical protein
MAILIAIQRRPRGRPQEELLDYFYRHVTDCQTTDCQTTDCQTTDCQTTDCQTNDRQTIQGEENSYPSFAVMEIFAFSTFDTGQPFSAASAYF